MSRRVEVRAPSRLHFGMFGFGPLVPRQFGGVGVMIDDPCLRLRITPNREFRATGPDHERAVAFARLWSAAEGRLREPECLIEIVEAPPVHAGLGSGTQLGLAVAAGLDAWAGRPRRNAPTLAKIVGRGKRSAVGIHGFDRGGLIVEAGKTSSDEISPLVERVALPHEWRILLAVPDSASGPTGSDEQQAFDRLPPVSLAAHEELWRQVQDNLLPAARAAEFERFATSVERFGRLAGECFATAQGGPYNGPVVTSLVEAQRARGLRGVGQSSWGPAVYAWTLERDADLLHPRPTWATAVNNRGATVEFFV